MDEAAVLPCDIDDQRLARVRVRADGDVADVDPVFAEHVGDDTARNVAADSPHDADRYAHLGEINRDVGGATAEREQDPLRHYELARRRKTLNRRTHAI